MGDQLSIQQWSPRLSEHNSYEAGLHAPTGDQMPDLSLPSSIANRMVERMFDGGTPNRFEDILYPACGDGALISAVEQYCDTTPLADQPGGVALDTDADALAAVSEEYPNIDTRQTDFLGEPHDLGQRFDYIICDPPAIAWEELTKEQQRAYAGNSGVITVDDDQLAEIEGTYLFIEQALRLLTGEGRAVFLTAPTYKTDDAASGFRELLYRRTEDIVDVRPEDHPALDRRHVITVIDNSLAEEESTLIRYDPVEYEAMLNGRVDHERPFTAQAVMTPDPEGYPTDEGVARVYLDLLYEDYDAAPVYSADAPDTLVGYVSRETLLADTHAQLSTQVRELTQAELLTPDADIWTVIEALADERFQFIGDTDSVQGIITRFDLNQLPVYLHLYDCFSEFEIGLRNLIRAELPDWSTVTDVRVAPRRGQELYADKLAAAKLSTLLDIIEEGGLLAHLPEDTAHGISVLDLKQVRDTVAHYNPLVHTMSDTDTFDEDRRSAPQLHEEYRFLQTCIDRLAE